MVSNFQLINIFYLFKNLDPKNIIHYIFHKFKHSESLNSKKKKKTNKHSEAFKAPYHNMQTKPKK